MFASFQKLAAILLVMSCGARLDANDLELAKDSPKPNIILFLADDLGWGDVGYHGSEIQTPNIDSLAESGTRLNRLYVMPVCSPTRAALLTGRHPIRLGLQCGVVRPWATHGLPVEERTLPEAIKTVGYQTAIVGKWHLGHRDPSYLPTRRGFDHQYGHYNGALDYFTHVRDGGLDWHRNDKRNDDRGYTTDLIADEAVRVIRQHDQTNPLFLYVPFNAPHTPIQAPKNLIGKYSGIEDKKRRVYAAMVDCMDQAVGRILNQLKTSQFDEQNTLIIFLSDNGGIRQFGSVGPWKGQKGRLYEGGVRAPAVMVWKTKLKPGSEVNEPMHVTDIYPTLLNLVQANLNQPKQIDGKNVWPTIAQNQPTPHQTMLLNITPFTGAIIDANWKLVWNGGIGANQTRLPKVETWELYDLDDDPTELNNQFATRPAIAKRLKRLLNQYQEEAVQPNLVSNKAPKGFQSPAVWGE